MGILSKLFGNGSVAKEDYKTTHQFYAEKYTGTPEIHTWFDGMWTSEVIIYKAKGGGEGARTVVKSETKAGARAKAQQWMQDKMASDYAPEVNE